MNLERVALAAIAKREEKDFLRALRDLLAPPDGESAPFVSDALNLIGDRLMVLAAQSTRPEALRSELPPEAERYARITVENASDKDTHLRVCGKEVTLKVGESAAYCLSDGEPELTRDAERYRWLRLTPAWYTEFGRNYWGKELDERLDARMKEIAENVASRSTVVGQRPLDMLLFCPRCNLQHVDAPKGDWTNPPHATHTCQGCGLLWRPSNGLTNGVAFIDCGELKHAERANACFPHHYAVSPLARRQEKS